MRIVLLTDLHFGRARPDLIDPLLDAVATASPDLVIVAGDFVQRARTGQFQQARQFLDRLSRDWIAVPGNHDIPLFNLPARIFTPRAAYHRWISPQTEPRVQTDTADIVGLDTTYRWHHQRGRITARQIDTVAGILTRDAASRTVIVVAHHPFHHAPDVEKKVMTGAAAALDRWSKCGPHIILSGHLHTWMVEPFIARMNRSMTLQVHCGTGLSTRLRGEPNDFAILDLDGDQCQIRRMAAGDGARHYADLGESTYRRSTDGWQQVSATGSGQAPTTGG